MIQYIKKDLFKAAKTPSILAHACNTHGIWGGGIALQFSENFPSTEDIYEKHCSMYSSNELLGTTLLINSNLNDPGNEQSSGGSTHVIACLFTSEGGGGNADSPAQIVQNTKRAIQDLETQLTSAKEDWLLATKKHGDGDSWLVEMPKINAGIFRVPWEDTERVLKESKKIDYNVYVID